MHQPRQPAATTPPPSIYGFIAATIVGAAVFAMSAPAAWEFGPGSGDGAPLAIAICAMVGGTTAFVGAVGACIVAVQRAHAAITARR